MSFAQSAFLLLVFVIAGLGTYLVITRLVPGSLGRRVESLGEAVVSPQEGAPSGPAGLAQRLAGWLAPFARPSLPEGAWERSPLRIRFYNAGFRSTAAPIAYFGSKTVLTFVLPALLMVQVWASRSEYGTTPVLVALLGMAAVGYYLPNVALARLIAYRQRELFEAFPDALDLMRVCVEAGLAMDAAIERVGREMALESPALSEELHLVSLELRAGGSRSDALRNLALRVAVEDIDAMVAMLIQADRFGTSVAESLRVHAASLRSRRRLIAEESAAKLPVKLLVPLIFCILPALLAVLLGPAMISVYRIVFSRFTGA